MTVKDRSAHDGVSICRYGLCVQPEQRCEKVSVCLSIIFLQHLYKELLLVCCYSDIKRGVQNIYLNTFWDMQSFKTMIFRRTPVDNYSIGSGFPIAVLQLKPFNAKSF
jgi:hypothetical protein